MWNKDGPTLLGFIAITFAVYFLLLTVFSAIYNGAAK